MRTFLTLLIFASVERATADAFTPPQAEAKPATRFEVVSIKPTDPPWPGGRRAGAGSTPRSAGDLRFTPGRVAAPIVNTTRLLMEAYGVRDFQLSGAPAWVESDLFAFEGKSAGPASDRELRLMLRTFLNERFQLEVHRDTRETEVLAMTVAKSGFKLPEAPPSDAPGGDTRGIASLAAMLSHVPGNGLPVVDKTGLKGQYRFRFNWEESDDLLPTVAREFGLKFEKQKEPLEILVIDRIQKPDPN